MLNVTCYMLHVTCYILHVVKQRMNFFTKYVIKISKLKNNHVKACELRTLPSGQYLLSHDQKSGPFCRLLQASGGHYFINELYCKQ